MNNLEGKRAILYRRVSTTDQKDYGNSLNEQKHRLREYCSKNAIEVIKEFEEDYSAKNFNRPAYLELRAFAKKNKSQIDFILVHKWDRFSRNAMKALEVIDEFNKMDIEINAIDQWIDYNEPYQKIMLLLNLGVPEVDNKVRSNRVIAGMRRGLKEGRWNNRQPKGYVKGKDELGKPLMKPDVERAPLITELFSDYALGIYSQNELIKNPKYRKLKLCKSGIKRTLTQIAYTGKIKVPAYKDEPEIIVDALHEPLITMETFNKVQYYLNKKNRYKQKSNKLNPNLPLRGYLQCPRCGSNLTGSASTSKTGAKHHYYHCNPRNECRERVKVKDAHDAFVQLLNEIQPTEEVCDLFELVLEDKYKTSEKNQYSLLKKVEADIEKLESRKDKLTGKLIDGVIDDETYKKMKSKLDADSVQLSKERGSLSGYQKDIREFVKFGLFMLKNISNLFEKASTTIKQKLISSIFKEKLVFKDGKYRTPIYHEAIKVISVSINKLEEVKTKKGVNLAKASLLVLGAGLEPARTLLSIGF